MTCRLLIGMLCLGALVTEASADIPRPQPSREPREVARSVTLLNEYRILVHRIGDPGDVGRLVIPAQLVRDLAGTMDQRPVKRGQTIVAGSAVALAIAVAGILVARRRLTIRPATLLLVLTLGVFAGGATVWANMAPPLQRDRVHAELERLFAEAGGGERIEIEVRDVDLPYIQLFLPREAATGAAPTTQPGN